MISHGDCDGSSERAEWSKGHRVGIGVESGSGGLVASPPGAGSEVSGGDDKI